ncbi:MAG: right-handed parallel beta-helix repeat-containing protein, partial [Lutibacter sp.]
MKNILFILCISLFFSCGSSVYYVNSELGNDANSGKSPGKAWASLQKVNQAVYQPGDKILFKSGTTYYGQLEPKGSGIKDKPISIDRYGIGKKPAIHGEGNKLHTLLLYNVEYWEVRNLEITNTGSERVAHRRGVIVRAENFGDCNHIVLDSLEIHHVNGSLVKKDGGGSAILWENSGDKIPTRFVDLIIQNNHLHHSGRNGINAKGNTKRDKWFPSIGVIIRNNLLENIPGDGIVPIGCDGAIVENNVLRDFPDILSHEEAAAGIWPWSSDNTLIQFNEVSGHKAKWDGQGYDADYNCIGTTIQYNYSHDNYGGFMLICNDGFSYQSAGNIGTKNTMI